MSAPDLLLFATRRFGPLFVVVFLGVFKNNAEQLGLVTEIVCEKVSA